MLTLCAGCCSTNGYILRFCPLLSRVNVLVFALATLKRSVLFLYFTHLVAEPSAPPYTKRPCTQCLRLDSCFPLKFSCASPLPLYLSRRATARYQPVPSAAHSFPSSRTQQLAGPHAVGGGLAPSSRVLPGGGYHAPTQTGAGQPLFPGSTQFQEDFKLPQLPATIRLTTADEIASLEAGLHDNSSAPNRRRLLF